VALILTDTSGSWTAAAAPLASSASGNESVLESVNCLAATTCVAVGFFSSATADLGLLETFSGSWTAAQAPLPSNMNSFEQIEYLDQVSCYSATTCVAIGIYLNTSFNLNTVVLSLTGGSWSAASAPVPSGAASSGQETYPGGVACVSSTSCLVFDSYLDSSGNRQGSILTDTSGSWSASKLTLHSGAASSGQQVYAGALSCVSSASCVAVGAYFDSSGNEQGLLVTDTAGTWASAEATLPADAGSDPYAQLDGVSCSLAGCAAGAPTSTPLGTTKGCSSPRSAGPGRRARPRPHPGPPPIRARTRGRSRASPRAAARRLATTSTASTARTRWSKASPRAARWPPGRPR
jgi:hypothetical protein